MIDSSPPCEERMTGFIMKSWWSYGLLCWLLACSLGVAQESGDDPQAGERKTPPLPEMKPEPGARVPLYYLPNERGKLLMVPGFTMEDFDRVFLQEQNDNEVPEPKVVLEKIHYQATAEDDRLELTAKIDLTTTTNNWVNVPLRFPGAVLVDAESEEESKLLIEYQSKGYSCWLRPKQKESTKHRLRLNLLLPIEKTSETYSVRLNGPRASQTSLELQVPLAKATLEAGRLVKVSQVDHSSQERTKFTISALPSDASLRWQPAEETPVASTAVLQVSGAIYVVVDGQSVRSEAELTLKSYQDPFQSFRLRLPDGAKLVGPLRIRGLTGGISYSSETVSEGPPSVVEVQLDEPVTGPITVTCATLRLPNEERKESPVQFLGFEVLGAGQQSGYLAIDISGNWQLAWEPRRSVEQVEIEELPDSLRSRPAEIAYQYYSQPASLPARIVRRQPSVSVEPNYSFVVEETEVILEARLEYSVRRASVRQLEIVLPPEWELELGGVQTTPANLIDQEKLAEDETRPLIIPFSEQQLGEFEVFLQARLPLKQAQETLQLSLPAPLANRLGPAVVEIQPANNVRLHPLEEQFIGLSQFTRPGRRKSSQQWQQAPLLYRTSVATAKFVAGFEILLRQIEVEAETAIRLQTSTAQIVQNWNYQVLYEPVSEITLQIPSALREAQDVELLLDGQRLDVRPTSSEELYPAALQLVRIDLETPQIGEFQIQLRYTLPIAPTKSGATTEHVFPLVFPGDATPSNNQLTVTAMPGTKVQLRGSGWELRPSPRQSSSSLDSGNLVAVSKQPQPAVHVIVDVQDTHRATHIRRAWLQTWMVDQRRRDRLAYLLTGQRDPLVIELPPGTETSSLEVFVGGESVVPQLDRIDEQFALTVPLPSETEVTPVEINYTLAAGASRLSELIPPRASPSLHQGQTYWELIVPARTHLLWSPRGVQPEYQWTWNHLFWGRSPLWSQQELERWVGVRNSPDLPPSTNRYLFSHWGSIERLQVQSISRPVLVLICSLASLMLGMALIYLSWLRHRGMLLLLVILIGAAGFWAAEIAPLILQAALLGILLTATAGLLDQRVQKRSGQGLVVRSAGSSITPRTPVGSGTYQEEPLSQGSTATASIAIPGSQGGSS